MQKCSALGHNKITSFTTPLLVKETECVSWLPTSPRTPLTAQGKKTIKNWEEKVLSLLKANFCVLGTWIFFHLGFIYGLFVKKLHWEEAKKLWFQSPLFGLGSLPFSAVTLLSQSQQEENMEPEWRKEEEEKARRERCKERGQRHESARGCRPVSGRVAQSLRPPKGHLCTNVLRGCPSKDSLPQACHLPTVLVYISVLQRFCINTYHWHTSRSRPWERAKHPHCHGAHCLEPHTNSPTETSCGWCTQFSKRIPELILSDTWRCHSDEVQWVVSGLTDKVSGDTRTQTQVFQP